MIRRIVLLALILHLVAASGALGQEVQVAIDKIDADRYISGVVRGIGAQDTKDFKVVIYVRTDRWYIHPYAQGGEGKAWAAIGEDGSWKIETVRREFAAATMAALVMPKDAIPPVNTENVQGIKNRGILVRELEGTPDHGKL